MYKELEYTPRSVSLKFLVYDLSKIIAALPALIIYRPKYIFENEAAKKKIKGGALLIANHISYEDPIIVQVAVWYRRHHFLCTDEFFRRTWPGLLFRYFLCIPISKENFSVDTFRTIMKHLQNDELVSMFPEGSINLNEGLNTLKKGALLIAFQSKKPIVPIYMKRRKNIFERTRIVIGEPIDMTKWDNELSFMKEMDKFSKTLSDKEHYLMELANRR